MTDSTVRSFCVHKTEPLKTEVKVMTGDCIHLVHLKSTSHAVLLNPHTISIYLSAITISETSQGTHVFYFHFIFVMHFILYLIFQKCVKLFKIMYFTVADKVIMYVHVTKLAKTECTSRFEYIYIYAHAKKWNESGFRPPLCTYRLNWARRTSWGWWNDWDDTVLQTQDSKFEP